MHFFSTAILALGFISLSHSSVLPRQTKPPAFLLAGGQAQSLSSDIITYELTSPPPDSTTAPGGGWGDAFIALLGSGATGTNYAKGGKTTVDFRSGGFWTPVLNRITALKSTHQVFVTIQFGHNDQKVEKGISIAQFKTNLGKMVDEVIAKGGTPILVSSLTRRTFTSSTGKVLENLAEHSAAALAVASAKGVPSIDLNRKSTDYVNKIGQANADLYNLAKGDRTHLNTAGAAVFGTMVAGLIRERGLGGSWVKTNAAIWTAINEGRFILP